MKKIETKALVEGAIFAAITALIGILSFYIPVISVISVVWAAPIIIIGFRHGLKISVISTVVATLLAIIFTSPGSALNLFIAFAIPGIVMGYMLSKKYSPILTIFITGALMATCIALGFVLSSWISGIHIADISKQFNDSLLSLQKSIDSSVAKTAEMYKQAGIAVTEEQLRSRIPNMQDMVAIMKTVLPALFLCTGVIFSFVNFKMVKVIFKRMRYPMADIAPFSRWSPSEPMKYAIMAMVLAILVGTFFTKVPIILTILQNVIYLIMFILIIIGLSVSAFFMDRFKVPKAFKIIVLIIAPFAFGQILMILGFIDVAFNLRRLGNDLSGGAEGI